MSTALSLRKLAQEFCVGYKTVHKILALVSKEIIFKMATQQLPVPTHEIFVKNAQNYEELFHFPNAIGAIDGKHFPCVVNNVI